MKTNDAIISAARQISAMANPSLEAILRSSGYAHEANRVKALVDAVNNSPWDQKQDDELRALFARGNKLAEIARAMGRTPAGIVARLERLEIIVSAPLPDPLRVLGLK